MSDDPCEYPGAVCITRDQLEHEIAELKTVLVAARRYVGTEGRPSHGTDCRCWGCEIVAAVVATAWIPAELGVTETIRERVPHPSVRAEEDAAGVVTCAEAHEILLRYNASHFHGAHVEAGGERARYSIPADPRRDDDIRLAAFINRAEKLEALYQAAVTDHEATIGENLDEELGPSSLAFRRALQALGGVRAPEARPCRRCSECPGQEHHWLMPEHDPETDTSFVPCKHCPEKAQMCEECFEAPVWPIVSDAPVCAECRLEGET